MEQIGKYKILAHIGHGAMGSVEKAEAPDGTIVAIKTLFPQFVYEEEYVKRFKREAALAKKLSHPNVVKVLEVGEDQDGRRQYIVMEYIDGKTLAEYMHDKGMLSAAVKRSSRMNEKVVPGVALHRHQGTGTEKSPTKITTFSAKETIKIIRQLAGVLQAASDIGLLHRDIKPQNILLDKKGNAKLLDFGLAKDTEALVSMLSMTGQSIGTPPYMSPEQHEGSKEIDMRSDLYSLGCTAYHMLTGRPPFPGPTASAFARQHCDDIPDPVHTVNQDCPLNLSQVIDRLLAKKPENRHQSPAELIEDLNRVERGEVPLKLYKPKKSKKHNPVRNWLTIAATIIIVAGGFIGWNFYKSSNAETIITEALSDAGELAVEHKFKRAKNILDDIISEYTESNPEQVKQAEALRVKLIGRYGKWIASQAARERQKEASELTRAEGSRKRKLYNCLRNAARLKNNENRVKEAATLVNQAYQLCNSDAERTKVAAVEKQVEKALAKIRPWAAVADFTLDRSVKAELTGSAVAVKLEQALGSKYRLVTRNQVRKALGELRFQASDLADRSKAKQFGKLVGAEYLISGSVIQLGREITVACQIFSIETGAIRQTAEVSAVSVDDFNYMIRDAAKILGMSNAEKRKYIDKLNSSKRASAGKYPSKISQYTPGNKKNRTIPGLGMKLVYVAPGSFLMGSNDEASSKPLRKVEINKAYWIGKYELTQREYQFVMGTNPSQFKGDNRPVEQVSWNEARAFCQKLTEQEKKAGRLPSGYEYRLPTEAEWEFAARGGVKSQNYKYSGSNDARAVVWNKHTAKKKTHEVGTKAANELGIHDMSGNVYEWCLDNWHKDYNKAPLDAGPWMSETDSSRVYRSGGLFSPDKWCKVAHRSKNLPDKKFNRLGFRVALAPVVIIKTTRPKVQNRIIPGLGMKLIYVAPGTFDMGSYSGISSEKPVHEVTIHKAYWIGKYEVTQNEYQTITGTNPSHFKGGNKPVEKVSWHDAVKFCKKLTERERKAKRLPFGYEYHLPTEAEWEFAARGGIKNQNYKYSGSNSPGKVAWYSSNSGRQTHEAGKKSANELGIYDMSGNVWEWCQDDWHGNYKNAPSDANRWGKGTTPLRVRRGGGWRKNSMSSRTTLRSYSPPTRTYNYLGFRVVLRSYFKSRQKSKKISFPKFKNTKTAIVDTSAKIIKSSQKTTTLTIEGKIDGSDEILITSRKATWKHKYWGWPANIKINGIEWNPRKEPVIKNRGNTRYLPPGTDFSNARLLHKTGRDTAIFIPVKNGLKIYFTDSINGSDNYKLVISLSSTKKKLKTEVKIEKKYQELSAEDHLENIKKEKSKARKRMYDDMKKYSQKQFNEIESLYQSIYKLKDPEKTRNLRKLIAKYPHANRTGCALLYLAKCDKSDAQEPSLLKVISKYNDCYYGDGVNVGACARFFLAEFYLKKGNTDKAELILNELRRKYPAAISHRKQNLASLLEAMLK